MTLVTVYGLSFGAAALAGGLVYPLALRRVDEYASKRAEEASERLSDMFMNLPYRTIWLAYLGGPLVLGGVVWLVTGKAIAGLVVAPVGLVAPRMLLSHLLRRRQELFYRQLVDGLLLLSSSLKAGLSMTQAFAVLAEEMPSPISQEIGLVLKETRMGVAFEEALAHLKQRMPSDDVTLFVTAVLVSRETGGDITRVFGKLVDTLRERKKLKDRVNTLTFMARLQGAIMGMLPFVFGTVVYKMNPAHFQFFLTDPLGRMAFAIVIGLTMMSALLFFRFSRSPM